MKCYLQLALSFKLYSELSIGAYNCILHHGTDSIKKKYLPNMVRWNLEWNNVFNRTSMWNRFGVIKNKSFGANRWNLHKLTGQKIFITSGDHDLTENIIHLVLARTPDSPSRHKRN